jgi:hypothetical protein
MQLHYAQDLRGGPVLESQHEWTGRVRAAYVHPVELGYVQVPAEIWATVVAAKAEQGALVVVASAGWLGDMEVLDYRIVRIVQLRGLVLMPLGDGQFGDVSIMR